MTDALHAVTVIVLLATLAVLVPTWWRAGGIIRLEAWATARRAAAEGARMEADRAMATVTRAKAAEAARLLVNDLRQDLASAEAGWAQLDAEGAREGGVGRLRVVGG